MRKRILNKAIQNCEIPTFLVNGCWVLWDSSNEQTLYLIYEEIQEIRNATKKTKTGYMIYPDKLSGELNKRANNKNVSLRYVQGMSCFYKIEIDMNLPNHQKLAILYHEIGHWEDKHDYYKYKNSPAYVQMCERELQADNYALARLLREKCKQSLKWAMAITVHPHAYTVKYPEYKRRLLRSRLWCDCDNYIKNAKRNNQQSQ